MEEQRQVNNAIPPAATDPFIVLRTTHSVNVLRTTRSVIKLDQFLKLAGVVSTGGQAKQLILAGQVRVNGQVETRRGRKLRFGDEVVVLGQLWQVRWDTEADPDPSHAD